MRPFLSENGLSTDLRWRICRIRPSGSRIPGDLFTDVRGARPNIASASAWISTNSIGPRVPIVRTQSYLITATEVSKSAPPIPAFQKRARGPDLIHSPGNRTADPGIRRVHGRRLSWINRRPPGNRLSKWPGVTARLPVLPGDRSLPAVLRLMDHRAVDRLTHTSADLPRIRVPSFRPINHTMRTLRVPPSRNGCWTWSMNGGGGFPSAIRVLR